MTDQPTNCITLNSPPTEEILRLDKEGFHYKGEFIADAGEAHRLMVEFLNQTTSQPAPVAPSLKELALAALHGIHDQGPTPEQVATIRRALEALDD